MKNTILNYSLWKENAVKTSQNNYDEKNQLLGLLYETFFSRITQIIGLNVFGEISCAEYI